jgi:hypothetical protein
MGAYVAMSSKVLEELDLAQGALRQNLLAKDIGDLFDGDSLVGLAIYGGAVGGVSRPRLQGLGRDRPTKQCRRLLGLAP